MQSAAASGEWLHISMTINKQQLPYFPEDTSPARQAPLSNKTTDYCRSCLTGTSLQKNTVLADIPVWEKEPRRLPRSQSTSQLFAHSDSSDRSVI